METNLFPLTKDAIALTKNLLEAQKKVKKIHSITTPHYKKYMEKTQEKDSLLKKLAANPDSSKNYKSIDCEKGCAAELIKHGIAFDPEYDECPLIVAKNTEKQAKIEFCNYFFPFIIELENVQYEDVFFFPTDEKGRYKLNEVGHPKSIADELIELILKVDCTPHYPKPVKVISSINS